MSVGGNEQRVGVRFEALRPYLTQSPAAGDYERLSQTLGLSRNGIAVIIHRLSLRYAALLRSGPTVVEAVDSDFL